MGEGVRELGRGVWGKKKDGAGGERGRAKVEHQLSWNASVDGGYMLRYLVA